MLALGSPRPGLMGSSGVTGGLAKNLGIQGLPARHRGQRRLPPAWWPAAISPEKLSLRYWRWRVRTGHTPLALRYKLSKKVYLEAAGGVASSLDIFYKRDF